MQAHFKKNILMENLGTKRRMLLHFWILAFISAALFGASTPLGKFLLRDFSASQLAGLFYLGAALGVSIPLLLSRRGLFGARMDGRNILRLSCSIFFGGILGPLFLLWGLERASSASVSLWLNLELVGTVFLGHFFFRDQLGRWGWWGATLIGSASLFLSWGGGVAGWQAGMLLVLACLCWGLDNHYTALIDGILPMQSTLWKGLAAGSTNLAIGLVFTEFRGSPKDVGIALVTGALAYGASIALYITAAQGLGAVRSQMIFATAPFIGLVLSWSFLGEHLSTVHGLAAVCQMLGLALVFKDRHAHRHSHEQIEHTHLHSHNDGHHTHFHPDRDPKLKHSHSHRHERMEHSHPHWPDLHHRHRH
ncbi:MAG: EamA family transporter [Fibrobacteria bacterium]